MKVALFVLSLVASVLLAACGGGQPQPGESTPPQGTPPAAEAAVTQPAEPSPAPAAQAVRGDCPEGLFLYGAQPPEGVEKYCYAVKPDGSEVKQGPYEKWFADGKPEAKGQYADGEPVGTWIEHDSTDTVGEGEYKAGKRSGQWAITQPDGSRDVGSFENGVRQGVWTLYRAGGDLKMEEGAYSEGNRHGTWKYYDEAGLPTFIVEYDNGKIVSQKEVERPPAAEVAPAEQPATPVAEAPSPAATPAEAPAEQ